MLLRMRKVKFIIKMRWLYMFITAVCVLFLIKLRWPKNKSLYVLTSIWGSYTDTQANKERCVPPRLVDFSITNTFQNHQRELSVQSALHESKHKEYCNYGTKRSR